MRVMCLQHMPKNLTSSLSTCIGMIEFVFVGLNSVTTKE
jgi:hypothetical protein